MMTSTKLNCSTIDATEVNSMHDAAPLSLAASVVVLSSVELAQHEESPNDWRRLHAIVEAQAAIARQGLDLEKVMHCIAVKMQEITMSSGSVVEMVEGDEMVYRAAYGSAKSSLGLRLKIDSSLSGRCVTTGAILRCDDSETDDRVNREACRRVGARSMIVVPLWRGSTSDDETASFKAASDKAASDKAEDFTAPRAVGVLKVLSPHPSTFSEKDVHALQLMAGLMGTVLSQAAQDDERRKLLIERTETLKALQESNQRFRNSFVNSAIGKAIVALDGRWTEVNSALCGKLGYSESELMALTFQDITHPDDLTTDMAYVSEMLNGTRQTYKMEKRYFHRDGSIVWTLLGVSLVRDDDGNPLYFVSEIVDITAQKNAMKLLQQANNDLDNLAHRDALTGLQNRRAFDEKLQEEMADATNDDSHFSLIFFDIDHFKLHNDTFGHASGDDVLRAIGKLLQRELNRRDFAARYGGEEFALILPRTGIEGARHVAEKLRAAIIEYSWSHALTTASFGVATWQGEDAQTLLDHADRALYEAKTNGRNRVCVY